jgi:histone-lysine N-methyltransferase SETMAR
MRLTEHHRHCILFLFEQGRSASDAHEEFMRVFADVPISLRSIQSWFARFREGNRDLSDQPRSGRPSVVDEARLLELVKANPRQTTSELALELDCSKTVISDHLRQLGCVWKLEQWVPHELTDDQKSMRVAICSSLLSRHAYEPLFDRIVTQDEKWVEYESHERGHFWQTPGAEVAKCPKPELHPKKRMMSVWWSKQGLIHYELLPKGQTINSEIYCAQLKRAAKELEKKQPALANRKGVLYLHDNARPHVAKATRQALSDLKWEVLPHAPYSPDAAPTDYHLFRSLNNFLTNQHMDDEAALRKTLDDFFMSRDQLFWATGICSLENRWQMIVESDGYYVPD